MTYNPCDPCLHPACSCSNCPVQLEREARAEDLETERAIEKRREEAEK